jgi:DNA-binding NarL/FixJ family response regulator
MTSPTKRIMIMDDHSAVGRGVRRIVETKPNYVVVAEASTGAEAIDRAIETAPDIAILDYSIPELNGLELSNALKRLFPRIEILLYTMDDQEGLIMEVLRAGVRALVLKSDAERHLIAALDALSVHRPYFSGAISETPLDRYLESRPQSFLGCLTHREREVVQHVAEGRINKEIAVALTISVKTVETHRASAMHKLHLRTTADLVRYAVRSNIVDA